MNDPIESASEAGLKYVSDDAPGIRRTKKGKGFTYTDDVSGPVKDERTLTRIKNLVIPPAWQDVWICKLTNGHLQVTGRDDRNRKQYRYHEKWVTNRNGSKFEKLAELAHKLPLLRKKIEEDLLLTGLPREKVLAAVIKVMLITQSRIGNSQYADENESYGLTTILNKHAKVTGSAIKLDFKGKSGVEHDISFSDSQLSKIIRKCQELPGEELFAYEDDGNVIDVTSTHVNEYLKSITGEDFTAKDLRTWGGTCKALEMLVNEIPEEELTENKWKKRHLEVIKETAKFLRNTVAVCRKYYIHPVVFEADKAGKLLDIFKTCRAGKTMAREEKLLLLILDVA